MKMAESKTTSARKSSAKNLTIDVLDIKGKVVESMTLPVDIFGVEENPTLVAQAVRVYLANQRQGTSKTKSRGEINATTKKAWRQKGTGRARHGAKSAPIFVGGGVAFGPKPRDLSLKFPQKMKKQALFTVLTERVKGNSLKVVSGMATMEQKTKQAVLVFTNLSLSPSTNRVVFVTDGTDSVYRTVRNIEGVDVVPATLLSAYDAVRGSTLVFTKEGLDLLISSYQAKKN